MPLIFLVLLEIALWSWLVLGQGLFRDGPNGRTLSTDFGVFMSAAQLLENGGNPYDNRALYQENHAFFASRHLPTTQHQERLVRAGNPPLFYWALEPLLRLPYPTAAVAWMALMYLMAAAGWVASLRFLGWRPALAPSLAFLLMPQVVLTAAYGNVQGFVFADLACALIIARRYPFAAGAGLSLALVKPHLVLPLIFLVIIFHVSRPRHALAGLVSGSAALLVLSAAVLGPGTVRDWASGLVDWSGSLGLQPNLASFAGLYVAWAPRPLATVLGVLLLGSALGLTGLAWSLMRRPRPVPVRSVAWLWFVWFLALPYAHFPDEVLLTLPILGILIEEARWPRARDWLALYLLFFSVFLFATPVLSLTLLAAALLLCLRPQLTRRRQEPGTLATARGSSATSS